MNPRKIIIAADSFKGTLTSAQVGGITAEVARQHFSDCEVINIPIADGGEGSVDCFLSCLNGDKKMLTVKGPLMKDMESFYAVLDNKTAVIEMAACAGLPLMGDKKDPFNASTYGVGQLINAAVQRGVNEIILGLGGSATNDGGCGAAAACGVKFYKSDGSVFIPTGGTLKYIEKIEPNIFSAVKITAMCDIINPMHGESGAAYIFGPQKGASPKDVKILDEGLKHLDAVIARDLKKSVANVPGSGAAGAMGAGMLAFFNAELKAGIEVVLDTVGFDNLLEDADLVISGEGSFDNQSLGGKVVSGIAKRSKRRNVPLIVVAGGAQDLPGAYEIGVTAVFTINRLPESLKDSARKSSDNLRAEVDNIFRLIRAIKNHREIYP